MYMFSAIILCYVMLCYILSVIVFECMDLSIGQRVNVSGLSCVSNKVLGCLDSYNVICDLVNHQKSTVYAALV